jgi:hypothetical protein
MNKSYTYGVIALALVAILLASTPLIMKPAAEQSVDVTASVESTDGISNTAAVVQSVQVGQSQTVTWNSSSFPSVNIRISLIRKVSDNPASYIVVRTVEAATANDGSHTWVRTAGDTGAGLFVEIGCVSPTTACTSVISAI